jgi:hypothetical protein
MHKIRGFLEMGRRDLALPGAAPRECRQEESGAHRSHGLILSPREDEGKHLLVRPRDVRKAVAADLAASQQQQ